jgi:hypothetical protein
VTLFAFGSFSENPRRSLVYILFGRGFVLLPDVSTKGID